MLESLPFILLLIFGVPTSSSLRIDPGSSVDPDPRNNWVEYETSFGAGVPVDDLNLLHYSDDRSGEERNDLHRVPRIKRNSVLTLVIGDVTRGETPKETSRKNPIVSRLPSFPLGKSPSGATTSCKNNQMIGQTKTMTIINNKGGGRIRRTKTFLKMAKSWILQTRKRKNLHEEDFGSVDIRGSDRPTRSLSRFKALNLMSDKVRGMGQKLQGRKSTKSLKDSRFVIEKRFNFAKALRQLRSMYEFKNCRLVFRSYRPYRLCRPYFSMRLREVTTQKPRARPFARVAFSNIRVMPMLGGALGKRGNAKLT